MTENLKSLLLVLGVIGLIKIVKLGIKILAYSSNDVDGISDSLSRLSSSILEKQNKPQDK